MAVLASFGLETHDRRQFRTRYGEGVCLPFGDEAFLSGLGNLIIQPCYGLALAMGAIGLAHMRKVSAQKGQRTRWHRVEWL